MELKQDKIISIPSTAILESEEGAGSNKEICCQEPESVAQLQSIQGVFSAWLKLIKLYRNGGAPLTKDDSALTDGSESDSGLDASPEDALVSSAHFDVLAEAITKLTAHRPSITGLSN